jgi:hypothetical protein
MLRCMMSWASENEVSARTMSVSRPGVKPGQFGTSPRTNAVQLPGLLNDDFSVTKGLKFGEGRNLQLRADFFNIFKHYNPDPQTVGLAFNSKSTFGKVANGTSGGFATRVIQLAAKFYF